MNLNIMVGDKRIGRLNQRLVIQKFLDDAEIENIKELHIKAYLLGIQFSDKEISAKEYCKEWTNIQYRLQDAWKFEKNSYYHRFWEMRGCMCPKMDNDDAYPSGCYVYNASCPVHGHIFEEMFNGQDADT